MPISGKFPKADDKVSPRLRVGLTGGIGSGKSTVENMFARRGVPVIDADRIAREIVEPGQPSLGELVALLGPGILTETGALNRAQVRERVFKDRRLRQRVEGILHPRIRELMEARISGLTTPYCVLAVPLLLEAGQSELVDRVLVVDISRELQMERTCARDHTPPESVARIMDAQVARDERLAAADDVIYNDGTLADLDTQVGRLHRQYLAMAAANLPGTSE